MASAASSSASDWHEDVSLVTGFDSDIVTPPAQLTSNMIFQCGVCLSLPRDPMRLSCRHLICSECLRKLAEKRCPHCRTPFENAHKLASTHPGFEDFLAHRVRCRLNGRECGFVGDPVEVDDHQHGDCINAPWIDSRCRHFVSPWERSAHAAFHQRQGSRPVNSRTLPLWMVLAAERADRDQVVPRPLRRFPF